MSPFNLIMPAILLTLIIRALFSKDHLWRRGIAATIAGIVFFHPELHYGLGGGFNSYGLARQGLELTAAAYLVSWGFRSRDPKLVRLASILIGSMKLVPTLLLLTMGFMTALG